MDIETRDVLADAFGRVKETVHRLCRDLDPEALTWRPDPGANTIAWLVWHIGRVADAQIAHLAGWEERWTADGWAERFDLPFDIGDTGYGHTPEQVGRVQTADGQLLDGYVAATTDFALAYIDTVDAGELDRIVDRNWDPPVTAGVRLVSIVDDQSQHVGQAAYVQGMYERVVKS